MPLTLPPDLMVGVSGFRGRIGTVLIPELVTSLSAGFGAFLLDEGIGGVARVYLGRDSRTSGAMLADAARAGLVSVGCQVVDLGVVPTPTLLLAAEDADAVGALGVTASHNPADWNALKFAGGDGVFLDADRMGRFRDFLLEEEIPRAPWDGLGTSREDGAAVERHVDRILDLPFLDVERIRERRFHVAVDCVRGAGGVAVPPLLEALGCRSWGIGLDPDGRFPRDPEPVPANLGDLGTLVRDTGAELGFAVDPDVDRLAMVDAQGAPVGEDLTLALCSDVILGRSPGPVVTNLSTSQVVDDVARAAGVRCVRAPVGEINVARRMEREAAVVGGEGNGGVILPQLHLTRDAPLGVALILQHLLERGVGLREAVDRWPRYHMVKEKASYPVERMAEGYALLDEAFDGPVRDTQDGLRIAWPEAGEWLHVRPSGTEPVVRFIAEARSRERAAELVSRARKALDA